MDSYLRCKSSRRHFQQGKGLLALLCDCEIFADPRFQLYLPGRLVFLELEAAGTYVSRKWRLMVVTLLNVAQLNISLQNLYLGKYLRQPLAI